MSWKLDPTHSQVQFAVRHMMISTVRGRFTSFTADAEIDLNDLTKSSVSASAEAASVETGEAQRDGHLKSPDFFDAEKFPKLSLKSVAVRRKGDTVEVDTELTIKDVTRAVTFKGEIQGPGKDPWGNQRVGFSLSADVEREDFGLTWNVALETGGVLVAKKVKLELEAQFIQG